MLSELENQSLARLRMGMRYPADDGDKKAPPATTANGGAALLEAVEKALASPPLP